jgi:hypothetical protein
MTWHTATVAVEPLVGFLAAIRKGGGTITRCCPASDAVCVTWTSPSASADVPEIT